MQTENVYHAFLGGTIEEVRAGTMDTVDDRTGQPKTVTWENSVRITAKKLKTKLTGEAVRALVELYNSDESFRAWCEQC